MGQSRDAVYGTLTGLHVVGSVQRPATEWHIGTAGHVHDLTYVACRCRQQQSATWAALVSRVAAFTHYLRCTGCMPAGDRRDSRHHWDASSPIISCAQHMCGLVAPWWSAHSSDKCSKPRLCARPSRLPHELASGCAMLPPADLKGCGQSFIQLG
jgi:hypothetical protein